MDSIDYDDSGTFDTLIEARLTEIIKSQAVTIMRQDRELIDLRVLITGFFRVMEHDTKRGVIG